MKGKIQLYLLFALLIGACKSPQPLRPEPQYDMTHPIVPLSSLYVPVRISKTDLIRMVNQAVKNLKMDNSNQPKDGYTWSMAITKPLNVDLEGHQILSTIPLDVSVKKDLGITSLRAAGELEVTLRTLFHIREDWTVQTYTTLEKHRWLRKPVARVAGLNLPIGALTDWVIDYSRPKLTSTIDKQIEENVDLRAMLAPLWTVLKRPIQLSESMDLWFRFEPRLAGIEPFTSDKDGLHSAVHLTGLSRIKAGGEPTLIDPDKDPQFGMAGTKKDSLRMIIHTEIPYAQAERMAEDNLIGQKFGSGKQEVTVEGIDLYGQGEYLIASLFLKGGYKGQVHLRGKPHLNIEKNQIELADFDFDIQTRNILHRSAAWLFKGNIRNALHESLVFPLEDNLGKVTKEINGHINNFKPGPWIRLDTPGLGLDLQEIRLTTEGMMMDFLLSGQVVVHLKAFD
jgi:hypothetical protein